MILRKGFTWAYPNGGSITLLHPFSEEGFAHPVGNLYATEEEAVEALDKFKNEAGWSCPNTLYLLTEYRTF